MNNIILSALMALPVAELSYTDWITVGMALKEEGFPCSVWEDWSRNDSRYCPDECERKWESFNGSGVKGGSIVQMAKDHGWTTVSTANAEMGWDDTIEYDGANEEANADRKSTDELVEYLETIFEANDIVGYVTSDVGQNENGKWIPYAGVYHKTAGELIASLKKYPDDLGATVGDWKPEAGAWIKFNPLDGKGVKKENVTKFTYALVECDEISIEDQHRLYRQLELPIAALINSGGKSLHAIVHIDADNNNEYQKRVQFLYEFLKKNNVPVDRQNKNPNRNTRMPGVTRNGNRQRLVATNIGRKSWTDWMDFVEGYSDDLPAMVSLADYVDNAPEPPAELIEGILRKGHKMLISGSSKAGKSFLLMELCIAIAEGLKWLGFQCTKGRVLYVNLEIDPASAINRLLKIYEAMGIPSRHSEDIVIWNLRGHAVPLDQLVPKLIRRVRNQHFDAIVIDPIYKVITGDENNATEMGRFCNQFDRICTETGCSTIYCHHHSKGTQGSKRAMDRASGSGVFARDPDAQLDMIQLELTDDLKNNVCDGNATAWRLESSLREFPNIKPVNFWFEYPVHRVDEEMTLEQMPAQGTADAGRTKNPKSKTANDAAQEFRNAYDACNMNGCVTVKDMMGYLGVTDKTVYARLSKLNGEFKLLNGAIYKE